MANDVVKSDYLFPSGGEEMSEEERKYYESEAKRKWQKENTVFIGVKLQKSTDADILQFLEGKQRQTVIKYALREYIQNHQPTEAQPAQEEKPAVDYSWFFEDEDENEQ